MNLDAAWAEAEEALPEGWFLSGVTATVELDKTAPAGKDWTHSVGVWTATAEPVSLMRIPIHATDADPAGALRALAAKLRERAS